VGDALFFRFGGENAGSAFAAYRRGELSAVACYREQLAACPEVKRTELDAFLAEQKTDPSFGRFAEYARERGFALTILSDGMDLYIRAILEREGLGWVPFRANILRLAATGRFEGEFPYQDEVCDRCACCKRNHMLNDAADEDAVVYVGEGFSDRCPAAFADMVFAKDELLKHCIAENISYFEYDTFDDILRRLEGYSEDPRVRPGTPFPKRRRAALARRDVFLGG
jgi:2-hydroxy-3-keto-5-methylthiopentenyl-1-phosphate phosphatase